MTISEVQERSPELIAQLTAVWEKSVKATHLFLSATEIAEIKKDVPQALRTIPHLVVAENEHQRPVAFMGVAGQMLEMLFIAPADRGSGLGRQLIQYGIDRYGINALAVNEQNPAAKGFYEHMGFRVEKRTDRDEQGRPYPLLYMKLK